MKCPSCASMRSNEKNLDNGLQALQCAQCEGYWIKAFQYWRWRENQGSSAPAMALPKSETITAEDSTNAKTCPECSKILLRYEVGHGTGISLEKCSTCGGIWFDKNEWELLKTKGLHDDVHLIFSSPWQAHNRKETSKKIHEENWQRILGEETYSRVKETKLWIDDHAMRSDILTFLNSKTD